MSRFWLRPFYAACGVLLLLIGLAWLPTPEPPAVPVPRHAHPAAPASPAEEDTVDYDQIEQTVLARPLFTIGRRPAKLPETASHAGGNGVPRLSGILITPYGRRAIFSPEGGKPLVVAVGASVGQHRVAAIEADGVRLDGMAQALHPTLDRQRAGGLTPNIVMPGFQPQPFNPGFQPNNFPQVQTQTVGEDGEGPPNGAPNAMPPVPGQPPFRGPIVPRGRE